MKVIFSPIVKVLLSAGEVITAVGVGSTIVNAIGSLIVVVPSAVVTVAVAVKFHNALNPQYKVNGAVVTGCSIL